jgi:hypothetical protein
MFEAVFPLLVVRAKFAGQSATSMSVSGGTGGKGLSSERN